jgi:multisubunit Na+/H+ antiporter MnhB subunit
MKPSGAFTAGVVMTVGMMVLVLYLRSRRRTVADGAEQFLGEADR